MTGPLVVLGRAERRRRAAQPAAPSSAADAALERWLEPVTAAAAAFFRLEMPHGSTELFLVGAAVADRRRSASALGCRATLAAAHLRPRTRRRRTRVSARVLNRKYYVDELYDAVDRPAAGLALPRGAVEGRGPGRGRRRGGERNAPGCPAAWAGWAAGSQTGQVGIYVVLFLVGALWILHAVIR